MRSLFPFCLLLVCSFSVTAELVPSTFAPNSYRSRDGALVLETKGDYVEPYFATKALLVAQDAGLDVSHAAQEWIHWGLAHQRSDGRFDRYCRKQGEDWKRCGAADADDSMLALWLQLLYRFAPDSGIPTDWKSSVEHSREQLSKLRNSRLGTYHVSGRNHVALLMDNVEVFAALKDIARAQARFGDASESSKTEKEAAAVASAIRHVFWNEKLQWYRPSMQKNQPAFYPDVVAQVFPWLADLPSPKGDPQQEWASWKERFGARWLATADDPHPWGLVAVAAEKMGDEKVAACWLSHSASLRYSQRWNILEEAVYQALQHKLAEDKVMDASVCAGAMRQQ